MTFLERILILTTVFAVISCNKNLHMPSGNIKIEHIIIEREDDLVNPPPPDLHSDFKTLDDWLVAICDSEKPEKPISTYSVSLFEAVDEDVVCLVGVNEYDNGSRIDFQPSNAYFKLPGDKYKKSSREQLVNKLIFEFREFTTTQKFKNSFLAQADSITINGTTVIWSK